MRSLNLATRPFRNERLPSLLAVASLVAVLLLTTYHLFLARDVMPDRTSELTRKLAEMEGESDRLRAEANSLRGVKPEAGALAQWSQLKDLVDRRAFSWTGLFSVLEDTLPDGVRLVSVQPKVEKGRVTLEILAVARTFDEAMGFHKALEDREEFAGVWPIRRLTNEREETEYLYRMAYLPVPGRAQPSVAPSPSPSPASVAQPDRVAAVAHWRTVP